MRQLARIAPKMAAGAYRTFQIAAPRATHTRAATCGEVDCAAMANGWVTTVDEATDLGRRQAALIRSTCRPTTAPAAAGAPRRYVEARTAEGLTAFTFPPGQHCFAEHRAPLGRPELFIVREGDWRGNPRRTAPRRHSGADPWVDEFAAHQDKLASAIEKG